MDLTRIKTFTDKYPIVGPLFWLTSVQYFIIQFNVARAWSVIPYSLKNNTISDLGNTACQSISGRYECSPLHSLMNVSFITLGLTMILGSLLIYQEFRRNQNSILGFYAMGLAGVGTILVGLFPENTLLPLHVLGAMLPFLIGNAGMIILGISLDIPKVFKAYTILSGIISLVALGLYVTHTYLGLGIGGMERITAYPQTIWLILFGIYMSKNHFEVIRRAWSRK